MKEDLDPCLLHEAIAAQARAGAVWERLTPPRKPKTMITPAMSREIMRLHYDGWKNSAIAREVNLSDAALSRHIRMMRGESRK